jgi:hypothetical protein
LLPSWYIIYTGKGDIHADEEPKDRKKMTDVYGESGGAG